MAKLLIDKRVVLSEMKYVVDVFGLLWGLMFASKKKVRRGACLVVGRKDKTASIHMLFCFYSYEVLFVNSKFGVIDKKVLTPWSLGYTPKSKFRYAIESSEGTFNGIEIGDKVRIKENDKRVVEMLKLIGVK